MSSEAGYYRHPTICGDDVVFVCEDDLWTVPASGGTARRLTTTPGSAAFPVISADGRQVAFAGSHDGPLEVYLMDVDGGSPERLSWFGSTTHPVAWHPDGHAVIVASDWRQPFLKAVRLYNLPLDRSAPEPLDHGPARAISYETGGDGVVIGRNSGDPARWKRYRGGTAGTLWIDRRGSGDFRELLRLSGNLANPMWIGSRIYFLSDHEGYGNLYSCTAGGRGLRRHTHHEDFYVRFPSTDGRRIVYHGGADLFVFEPATDTDAKIPVRIRSSRSQRNRKYVDAGRYLETFDVHPGGHSIATVHRGGLFTMPLWEGAATRHGTVSAARYRLGTWLADGKRLAAVTDEDGEEQLIVFGVDGEGRIKRISGDFGRPVSLAAAPAGPDWLALTNQRHELILVDVDRGRTAVVDRSRYGQIAGIAWSPDGRYLAYGLPVTRRCSSIRVCEVQSGKIHAVTGSDFRDEMPAFDPLGRYLYFLSWRVFDPVYDSHYFDLAFPKGAKPFLVPLKRDAASPFSAAHRAPRAPTMIALPGIPPAGLAGSRDQRVSQEFATLPRVEVEIDFEGIEERVVAFPVPEGRYGRVAGSASRVFFSSFPVEGSLDVEWFSQAEPPARGVVEAYDIDNDKVDTVAREITDFELSASGTVLAIRAGNRLRVVSSQVNAEQLRGDKPGRDSGWLDLSRIRLLVVPNDEWRQMFREAWRLQRDQYWTEDMAGLDWEGVYDRYLPLVDRVTTREEFSDLMWEMQGELGTSHCYELGGDYAPTPQYHLGFLGVDLELDESAGRWRVARIPRGDTWDPKRSSPLTAPGVGVEVGDEILEVDGSPVGGDVSPYERLMYRAGQNVQLKVRPGRRRRGDRRPRIVTVHTLKQEVGLRYRDWVERNREHVHQATGGRVGYVHIPNMGPFGYSEFHRYFGNEVDHDGLVIDVRWNGGGHVSQLLLEKLLRRRVGYDSRRWGEPDSYPLDAPMGPMVAITNEYAGSDGDIFSHCFKLYGLGPLIGKRTWGGVIGIWPRHSLVDGTVTTQPEFATWLEDVGWGVENYGTDPDIEVEIRPQDYAAASDPQMDRAITEILRILRRRAPRRPDFSKRPRLRPARLPIDGN